MPLLESQAFYSQIEKAVDGSGVGFRPLYFFFGDEAYLIGQAVQYLKVCALAGGAADFNFTQFYSSDADITTVKDEVETLPMMSSRRVVLLREVQDLTDKEWEELDPLFRSPVESTVFILVGGKVDKRKKFFRLLSEQAQTVEFKKPYENQIPGWIRHLCKGHGLLISDEAIQIFHRMVGSQLVEIESEIKKLELYLGGRRNIEFEDVAQVVSQRREENVFDLTESIAQGDRVKSLVQLVELLDQGQSPVGIVHLIARHLRILMVVKQGLEQGVTGQKLAQLAQVPSYYLQDYVNQTKKWTLRRLEQCLVILAETDKALKSSPLSAHIWLENMVLKISNQQTQMPRERNLPLT